MKKRVCVDSKSESVKALADLCKRALRDGQSVGKLRLVLERLSNRACPDVLREVTVLQKAKNLCRQLSNWNGSYCLTEALETSGRGLRKDKSGGAASGKK